MVTEGRKPLQSLTSSVHRLARIGALMGAAGVFFLLVASGFEVVSRYGFKSPTKWTLEISQYVMLFIVMAGLAYVQKEKAHIKVDILLSRFSEKTQKKFEVISSLSGIFYCTILSWTGFLAAVNTYHRGEVSIILGVPLYLVIVWVGIGAALITLEYLTSLIGAITK